MNPSDGEADRIRDRERATWSTAAAGWRKYDGHLRQMFRPVTEEILRRARIGPGMHVLDLASGSGEPSLSVAEKVGATGSVLGIDLAGPMLDVARENAASRGLTNITFRASDIEAAELPKSSFDAATMRWGIMFVPDPVAAMRVVHQALRPGATMVLATWGTPAENPMLSIPLDVLRRHVEVPSPAPGAPGVFAFADPQRVASTLTSAGFHGVETAPVRFRITVFRTGREYWDFVRASVGPVVALYGPLSPELRARVDSEMEAEAEKHRGSGGIEFPAVTWLGWGTR